MKIIKKTTLLGLLIVVVITIVLSGCGGINANTKPENIKSSIVTEKQWREACSFIGMRDVPYETINNVNYQVMRKLSVFLCDNTAEGDCNKLFADLKTVSKEGLSWACKISKKAYVNDELVEQGSNIEEGTPTSQLPSGKTHAYYILSEFMKRFVGDYDEFVFDEQSSFYRKTITYYESFENEIQKELRLKFKGNRLVCYEEITSEDYLYIIFYNFA